MTTFDIDVSHLSYVIFTFKNFFKRKHNFLKGSLEFPTRIKELPIGIEIPIKFEQTSYIYRISKYDRKP